MQAPLLIEHLSNKQKLLFDGYIRTECIHYIADIPADIINLCTIFFQLNITVLLQNEITTNELYELSMKCLKQSECFFAYEILQCLSLFDKDDYHYHNALGLVLDKWESNERAEKEFKIAIQLKPKSHIFRWNYGLLLNKQRKYDLAVKQFIESSEMDPNEPEYFLKSADCYFKLKDDNNAELNYLKSIQVAPNNSSYYMEYAKFLSKTQNCTKAQQYFEKAMLIEPENWKQIYHVAKYLRDYSKDYKRSEIYYQKCLEINNISYVHSSYGYLLYLMKRYKQAANQLDIALNSNDKSNCGSGSWPFYYYGLLQYQLGNMTQANTFLKLSVTRVDNISYILSHLEIMKEQDPTVIEYHLRYERVLKQKFKCN